MDNPTKTTDNRDITYHIGWKSGKIRPESPSSFGERLLRFLLRPVPYPSETVLKIALLMLLPAGFAAMCWMTYMLSGADVR